MKRQLLLLLFLFAVIIGHTQQTVQFNTVTGQIARSKNFSGNSDSVYNRVVITLPDTGFENLRVRINQVDIGFYNRSKPPAKNFIPLYAQDISSGQIVLKFKGRQLLVIGERVSPNLDSLLKGKDSVSVWVGSGTSTRKADMTEELGFYKAKETEQPAEKPGVKNTHYTSKYCQKNYQDSLTLPYLAGLSFLCAQEQKKEGDNCFCAPVASDPNAQIYLPPCYDPNGNAVSATSHILVDTRSGTSQLNKFSLFKLTKKAHKCNQGHNIVFEFNKKQKKMYLEEGTLVPVTVIAHKDSAVVIDSNYVNYFLDSAKAVETAYSDAGKKVTEPVTKTEGGTTAQDAKDTKLLQGTVNLRIDLMSFNSAFDKKDFVQDYYVKQLICLQKNIAAFFELPFIPATGKDLAEAIDNTITPETARQYAHFLCSALGVIADEYDKALKHESDYRQYTKFFQVPNADEITFKARTKNGQDLIGHKFLIKGGWKIDFSTGVFVTGLNSQEFVQVSNRFAYKDSLTGSLKDTTGNLLAANKGKLNFSTGFLVHLYRRSGGYFNWGTVTGITINDDDFKMLLGGSAMFRMGNGRLSFVAGAAVGKQNQLDANQQQYNIKSSDLPANKIYIQNDVNNQLPRFFAETNIQTYDKLKLSWFAGITYNFAGLTLGK